MNATGLPVQEKRSPSRIRVFRALLLWILLVLIMFGVRTHQRLSERTRIVFSVSLPDQAGMDQALVEFDGRPISSGERISLGRHTLTASHPKTEPFSTNLSIWYGEHNLGKISLKRSTGTLAIEVRPPARKLTVRGPEFQLTLTNTPGMTSSVPTDEYVILSDYAHWNGRDNVGVVRGLTTSRLIVPKLGHLILSSSHPETTFQLFTSDDRLVEEGELPRTIPELPEGEYTLHAAHHRSTRREKVTLKTGTTNNFSLGFTYGMAALETEPAGATVTSSDGNEWGRTPLVLPELEPATWRFNLRKEGYEPIQVVLPITVNATNSVRTNLISRDYTGAMSSARQCLADGSYDRALEAAADALRAKPEDEQATQLKTQATGLGALARAEKLFQQTNYAAAVREVQTALKFLPDSGRARELLASLEKRQSELAAAQRQEKLRREQERLQRPRQLFDRGLQITRENTEAFEEHKTRTRLSASEAQSAIANELRTGRPVFSVTRNSLSTEDSFLLFAFQDVPGGQRQCIIAGAQVTDRETEIIFKVLEYKAEHKVGVSGFLNVRSETGYTLLDPLRPEGLTERQKAQIKEGARMVTERLRQVVE